MLCYCWKKLVNSCIKKEYSWYLASTEAQESVLSMFRGINLFQWVQDMVELGRLSSSAATEEDLLSHDHFDGCLFRSLGLQQKKKDLAFPYLLH